MLKSPLIAITAEVGSILEAKVADVRNHPQNGILLTIPHNPMAILPEHMLLGESAEEKTARRAELIASPNTTILVRAHVVSQADESNGKHRFVVKEVDMAVENRMEKHIARLPIGRIMQGTVSRVIGDEGRNKAERLKNTRGVLVDLGLVTGLLLRSEMNRIFTVGDKIKVIVLSAQYESGRPKVLLSQRQAQNVEAESAMKNMCTTIGELTTVVALLASIPDGEAVGKDLIFTRINELCGYSMKLDPIGAPAFMSLSDMDKSTIESLRHNPRPMRVALTDQILVGRYLRVMPIA